MTEDSLDVNNLYYNRPFSSLSCSVGAPHFVVLCLSVYTCSFSFRVCLASVMDWSVWWSNVAMLTVDF